MVRRLLRLTNRSVFVQFELGLKNNFLRDAERLVKNKEEVELKKLGIILGAVAALGFLAVPSVQAAEVLNVYSSRHYDVDKQVYADFEKETGIKVNVVEGKGDELLERLTREKDKPEADLFLTVGAESIAPLMERGLSEGFSSAAVEKNIPARYRGEGWMGITARARVIAYPLDRVDPSKITSYDDLTKPEWKGKVLVRSSSSSYNVALLSSFIQLNGADAAKAWAQGVVGNLARTPKGNDRDQAKAVVAGEGDLAVMNSYYFIRMMRSSDPAEADAARKIGLIFPKPVHLNLSIAALVRGAGNKDNAVKFLEFLSGEHVQALYAEANGEFPLNPSVPLPEVQKSWGAFEPQELNYETLGKAKPEAAAIFDQVGWK